MHVLLLRHGQTDENARGILQGHSQTHLNDLGRQQARVLAERLRTFAPRVEALITSDLTRAVQTAVPVSQALGLVPRSLQVWRERGFGPFEGRMIGEAETWRAATGTWDLPGAEATDVFRARVRDALLDLVRDYAAVSCVGVITHGAAIRTVLNLLRDGVLGLADDEPMPDSVPIANCGIVHLRAVRTNVSLPTWRVMCVNDTAHLTPAQSPAFRVEE